MIAKRWVKIAFCGACQASTTRAVGAVQVAIQGKDSKETSPKEKQVESDANYTLRRQMELMKMREKQVESDANTLRRQMELMKMREYFPGDDEFLQHVKRLDSNAFRKNANHTHELQDAWEDLQERRGKEHSGTRGTRTLDIMAYRPKSPLWLTLETLYFREFVAKTSFKTLCAYRALAALTEVDEVFLPRIRDSDRQAEGIESVGDYLNQVVSSGSMIQGASKREHKATNRNKVSFTEEQLQDADDGKAGSLIKKVEFSQTAYIAEETGRMITFRLRVDAEFRESDSEDLEKAFVVLERDRGSEEVSFFAGIIGRDVAQSQHDSAPERVYGKWMHFPLSTIIDNSMPSDSIVDWPHW